MENQTYNPAEDENQGVLSKMAQGEQANEGVSQTEYMNPMTNQGPEPVKEEVNDQGDEQPGTEANGVNDDMLAEEDVENGDIEVDNNDALVSNNP
ncbi:hypothetical protein DYU11_28485 [Fibrisoma montanum]|uniref:Uncharacterized protein n=1 Tax=Fibrisoma montanum TaxID=2305895 RepID=A0A418LZ52_9BACT|nr:hypothetical protein [Fibrisoma montanum]RIV18512.1 hypothetical protein DYU11_28485 [Fibrisoma montanum]